MTTMTGMTALLLVALASWLLRIGFVVLLPAHRLPDAARGALGHVAPAALAAIVAVDLVQLVTGSGGGLPLAESLVAVAVIAAVAWWTRSLAICTVLALAIVGVLDLIPWG